MTRNEGFSSDKTQREAKERAETHTAVKVTEINHVWKIWMYLSRVLTGGLAAVASASKPGIKT